MSWSTGPAEAYGGTSSAKQDNSGWTVSRGGVTGGGSFPWLLVALAVGAVLLWKGKK